MTEVIKVNVCDGYSVDDGKKLHMPGDRLELPVKDAADLMDRHIVSPTEAALVDVTTKNAKNVDEGVAMITGAQTVEDLDRMIDGETRKGILNAAELRREELAAGK